MASLHFGPFQLDPQSGELRRAGARVRLRPQPCAVLAMLAERSGEFISRTELYHHLWRDDTYVRFDQGLNSCIKQIRRALRDDHRAPIYVETLPRRGYRFLAPVSTAGCATQAERAADDSDLAWITPLARALAHELTALLAVGTDRLDRQIQRVESPALVVAAHRALEHALAVCPRCQRHHEGHQSSRTQPVARSSQSQ